MVSDTEGARAGYFQFEDCLLKHYVRKYGWLPLCRQRLRELRKAQNKKSSRRLRYFTFCAVGAIDVLMLDVAKVISRSDSGRFDTVFFFDQTREYVDETAKRIPGAVGFPGEFVDVVLAEVQPGTNAISGLDTPKDAVDSTETRRKQMLYETREAFIRCFPFDVINLDLERHLYWPTEERPGRLVNAMRKIFAWQRNTLVDRKRSISVNAFTLLFTTRIGPENLNEEYMRMLRNYLLDNVQGQPELQDVLAKRMATSDLRWLEQNNFPSFFKLAVPKAIASLLDEQDWYVEDEFGMRLFEFERVSKKGPYKMLHIAMHVKRKEPPIERRAPGEPCPIAANAYKGVVARLFAEAEIVVSNESFDKKEIQADLENIKARRKRYDPDHQ